MTARSIQIPTRSNLTFTQLPELLPDVRGRDVYHVQIGRFRIGTLYKDPFSIHVYSLVGLDGHTEFFDTWTDLTEGLDLYDLMGKRL